MTKCSYIKFVSVLGCSKISFSYIQFEGCLQNNKDLGAANIIMRESELMHVATESQSITISKSSIKLKYQSEWSLSWLVLSKLWACVDVKLQSSVDLCAPKVGMLNPSISLFMSLHSFLVGSRHTGV